MQPFNFSYTAEDLQVEENINQLHPYPPSSDPQLHYETDHYSWWCF